MGWWRRILARFGSPWADDPTLPLGERGERIAAGHLRRRGYRVLKRNQKLHDDEIDLLALDPDGRTIVIVEVKARADDRLAPEASVHDRKQRYLRRAAGTLQQWRAYRDRPMRFDVIAVVIPPRGEPVVRHIVNAFSG